MNEDSKLNRRSFLGTAGAGLLGWIGGSAKGADVPKAEKPPLDSRFTYDVSQFAHTDPAQLMYGETATISTGLADPKCIATGPDNTVFVGGDRSVNQYDHAGQLISCRVEYRLRAESPFATG